MTTSTTATASPASTTTWQDRIAAKRALDDKITAATHERARRCRNLCHDERILDEDHAAWLAAFNAGAAEEEIERLRKIREMSREIRDISEDRLHAAGEEIERLELEAVPLRYLIG